MSATFACAGLARRRGWTTPSAPFSSTIVDPIISRQPFGQVPFLEDGDIVLFKSGACLLHLGRKSEALMPHAQKGEADVTQWLIAGLNSIEMVSVPWWFVGLSGAPDNPLEGWLTQRLERLEATLESREWLAASRFTVADILMADALRVPEVRAFGDFPALRAYVERACDRPAFKQAHADQLAHFAAADATRSEDRRVVGEKD